MKNYETEARERWGDTAAYREHTKKTQGYTKEKWDAVNEGLMAIFSAFAACRGAGAAADSDAVQAVAARLQGYITENYYTCTDEILAGLGQMYVADERFAQNIDRCGEGTAEFAAAAIAAYCKGRRAK